MLTDPPRVVLPGRWARIDVTSAAGSRASIHDFLRSAASEGNDAARADYGARLEEIARTSRENHGRSLHVAIELTPGIPVPASLSITMPPMGDVELDSLGAHTIAHLAGSLADDSSSAATPIAPLPSEISGVRQVYRRQIVIGDGSAALKLLQADYWLVAAAPARSALLSFSTPLGELEELMLDLFDAIVATTTWEVVASTAP